MPEPRQLQTLAEYLGISPADATRVDAPRLEDIADGDAFCAAVANSIEFRRYVVSGLVLGTIPPAVIGRLLDRAWGTAPERVEHVGADGGPIEVITEVRRTIVRHPAYEEVEEEAVDKPVTH